MFFILFSFIVLDLLASTVNVISTSKMLMKKANLTIIAWPMDPTSYVTEEANVDVANVNAMKVMLANFANAPRMNAQKVKLVLDLCTTVPNIYISLFKTSLIFSQ